ncbi:oxidoreductase [Paenibacillus koleovorans]|uniref:oxidoreductase n=1 Tax=Paenibacillus koleovorans TaxID=121608 RepID=UPI000FDB1B47|nr:oxidoreductase [Paenibacillus koleovorans]
MSGRGREERLGRQRVAVIAGSTGLIGTQLVRLLQQQRAVYSRVIVLTRRPLPAEVLASKSPVPLEQRVIDFNRLTEAFPDGSEVLTDADVYCALGTTIKKAGSQAEFRLVDYEYPLELGRLASQFSAARFLIVTAMGADARSRIFYNRVKGEVERELRALELQALRIFRPSLLLGEREEHRTGERIAVALAPLMNLLLRGPLAKYKPIEGLAVAQGMTAAATAGFDVGVGEGESATIVFESDQIAALARAWFSR